MIIRAVPGGVDLDGPGARCLKRVDIVSAGEDMIRTNQEAGADRVFGFGFVVGAGDNAADAAIRVMSAFPIRTIGLCRAGDGGGAVGGGSSS